MIALDQEQQEARDWFETLRDRICAAFEAIERESGSGASFVSTPWERLEPGGSPGGGGVRALMKNAPCSRGGVMFRRWRPVQPRFRRHHHGARRSRFFSTGRSILSPIWPIRPFPRPHEHRFSDHDPPLFAAAISTRPTLEGPGRVPRPAARACPPDQTFTSVQQMGRGIFSSRLAVPPRRRRLAIISRRRSRRASPSARRREACSNFPELLRKRWPRCSTSDKARAARIARRMPNSPDHDRGTAFGLRSGATMSTPS